MGKYLKTVGRFILFSGVIYVLFVVVWTHLVPVNFLKKNAHYPIGAKGFMNSRIKEVDTVKNVDVLFLGSSHAFRGFDPRIFKEKNLVAFNLGSPSQTPIQTRYLVERYLEQLNPRLVIYEVYPATFQNDGVESSLDLIANTSLDKGAVEMAFEVNHIKTYNALIYDGFRELLNLNADFKEPASRKDDRYVAGGFVESTLTNNMAPLTDEVAARWEVDRWEIKDQQWEAFSEVLALLEERETTCWLVQTPVTQPAYELYKNNRFIDSLFQTCGPYYNLNGMLNMDDERDFIDYHHLSQRGVVKTNTALYDLMKEQDVLKTRTN